MPVPTNHSIEQGTADAYMLASLPPFLLQMMKARKVKKSPFVYFDTCNVLGDVYPLVYGVRRMGIAGPVRDERDLKAMAKYIHVAWARPASKQRPVSAPIQHCTQTHAA